VKVIVLPLGDEHYAFTLESVQQVISAPRVTRLPVADAALLGLVNVRGEIVPLFDLAVLTETGKSGASDFAILVSPSLGPAARRCRRAAGVGGDRRDRGIGRAGGGAARFTRSRAGWSPFSRSRRCL